MYPESITKYNG